MRQRGLWMWLAGLLLIAGCEGGAIPGGPLALAQEGDEKPVQAMPSPTVEAKVEEAAAGEAKSEVLSADEVQQVDTPTPSPVAEEPAVEPTESVTATPEVEAKPTMLPTPTLQAEQPSPAPVAAPAEQEIAPALEGLQAPQADTAVKPLLPAPAASIPQTSSVYHRQLFNRVAAELYPIRWIVDRENPNQIDILDDELSIPEAMRESLQLPRVGWAESEPLTTAIKVIQTELEQRRQDALREVDGAQRHEVLHFSLDQLAPSSRAVAKHLLAIAPDVQVLYQLQVDPMAPALIAEIYKRGHPVELRLLQRNGAPVCGRFATSDYCSLLPVFPTVRHETALWPEGMTAEEFTQVMAQSSDRSSDPLLSPFTRTTRLGQGSYGWKPLSQVEAFQEPMRRIAQHLQAVAALPEVDPGLQAQLKAQAAAFTADQPYPFTASDQAWLQNTGELELLLGAYTTDRDHFARKAQFSFVLGLVRPEVIEWARSVIAQREAVEAGLATALSATGYKAHELPSAPQVRVIDAVQTAGAANGDGGPKRVIASDVPLPQVEEHGEKILVIANHLEASLPLLHEMALQALVDAPVQQINAVSLVQRATVHAALRGVGPAFELAQPALQSALRDAVAQWALPVLVEKGVMTKAEAEAIAVTHVAELLAAVYRAVDAGSAMAQSAKMQLAALAKGGAVTIKGAQVAFSVAKARAAYQALLQELAKLKGGDDPAAATLLLDRYLAQFSTAYGAAVEHVRAAALPRDIAVTYEIEG